MWEGDFDQQCAKCYVVTEKLPCVNIALQQVNTFHEVEFVEQMWRITMELLAETSWLL